MYSLDFSLFIEDRIRSFVGREWVFEAIDNWIINPKAPPFFVVTGEPGIGKTALAGRFTQIRKTAAHHFCIARRAETIDPLNFSRSISEQLTKIDGFAESILEEKGVHIDVNIYAKKNLGKIVAVNINSLIVEAPSASIAFNRAVLDPLCRIYSKGYIEDVLIVVDGLDEATHQQGPETIVDLVASAAGLPPNVRFVITTRPESRVLAQFEQRKIPHMILDASGDQNMADVRAFVLKEVAESETLQAQIAEQGFERESFAHQVSQASEGNFLYLTWLLPSIASGKQSLEKLYELPEGLDGIYREFFRTRMIGKDMQSWKDKYRSFLGVLITAQAPLTIQQVLQFTGRSEQDIHDISDEIRQFLDQYTLDQGQYLLYHQSVADFLSNKERAQEFWIEMSSFHKYIADYYLGICEGRWEDCDDYGLNHLAIHLFNAGETSRLVDLISEHWVRTRRERAGNSYQGFLHDVDLAWESLFIDGKPDPVILVRLSTARVIVHHRAGSISDINLKTLVKIGRVDEALSHARLRGDARERCRGLITVSSAIKNNNEYDHWILDDALQTAREVLDEFEREILLSDLACALAEAGRIDDARMTAGEIQDESNRASALVGVACALVEGEDSHAEDAIDEALQVVEKILLEKNRVSELLMMASALAGVGDPRAESVFDKALRIARKLVNKNFRVMALEEIAIALSELQDPRSDAMLDEALRTGEDLLGTYFRPSLRMMARALAAGNDPRGVVVFIEALQDAREIKDNYDRVIKLTEIGSALAEAVFSEALNAQMEIQDDYDRASALTLLARALAQAKDSRAEAVLDEAMRLGKGDIFLESDRTRYMAMALTAIASVLAEAGDPLSDVVLNEALQSANEAQGKTSQARLLRWMASALVNVEDPRAEVVLDKALQAVREIQAESNRSFELEGIAIALAEAGRYDEALQAAEEIQDEAAQASALGGIAAILVKTQDQDAEEVLAEALQATRGIWNREIKARAVSWIAIALAKVEDQRAEDVFREALHAAGEISSEPFRAEVLGWIARGLVEVDNPCAESMIDDFLMAVVEIREHGFGERMLNELAVAFSQFGDIQRALKIHDSPNLDSQIYKLSRWNPNLIGHDFRMYLSVLQEAIHVAGWVNPDWRRIHQLLSDAY